MVEPTPGMPFDAEDLSRWLTAQGDLGTKWVPRFVRVRQQLPQARNDKVNRQLPKRQAWITDDPVWWRQARETTYRLRSDDRASLRADFGHHDRTRSFPGGSE